MRYSFFVTECFMALGLMLAAPAAAMAASATAEVHMVDENGVGASIGTVTFADIPEGVAVKTMLAGLPQGEHGFHIHEGNSCEPSMKDGKMTAANAAGGHYDPDKTGKHLGPDGMGHKGDLPVLSVAPNGEAVESMLAKRITVDEIRGRVIMIHAGGDNYSDMPVELGGGGGRIACGVIR